MIPCPSGSCNPNETQFLNSHQRESFWGSEKMHESDTPVCALGEANKEQEEKRKGK